MITAGTTYLTILIQFDRIVQQSEMKILQKFYGNGTGLMHDQ